MVDEAFKLTHILLSNVPDEKMNAKLTNSSNIEKQIPFGEGIKFVFPLPTEIETDLSLFDFDVEDEKPRFSLKINTEASKAKPIKAPQENCEDLVTSNSVSEKANINWLKQKCDLYFGNVGENLNSDVMCSVIFDLLCSRRGNEEMQNELFELLGFDRFEFIQELLANREKVIGGGNKNAHNTSGMSL